MMTSPQIITKNRYRNPVQPELILAYIIPKYMSILAAAWASPIVS